MRDEHINIDIDAAGKDVLATLVLKRPIAMPPRPGVPVDLQAAAAREEQAGRAAVEVDQIAPTQGRALRFWLAQLGVVVAGDQDLVRVRLRVEPVQLRLELGGAAVLREVARVNEQIARG